MGATEQADMPLARCECGQVFDIPGVARSYKQRNGRCATCNGGPNKVDLPQEIKTMFPNAKPEAAQELARMATTHYMKKAAGKEPRGPQPDGRGVDPDGRPAVSYSVQPQKTARKKPAPKYPFDKLPPPAGGLFASFFQPFTEKCTTHERLRVSLAQAAWYRQQGTSKTKRASYKYGLEPGGVRVWRVK